MLETRSLFLLLLHLWVFITLRVPPMDSESLCTGDFWLKMVLQNNLNYEN